MPKNHQSIKCTQ